MNEYDDVMGQVRESFAGLRMDLPVEEVFSRERARRRHRLSLSGFGAAAVAAAGATAAVTFALGGSTPASQPGHHRPQPPAPVRLTAFSVRSGPGDRTTLILHKGPQYPKLDSAALRKALARHGIPALVTVGTFCRSAQGGASAGYGKVVQPSPQGDGGSNSIVIDGRSIPAGSRLSIGLFPGFTRMMLVKDGAQLTCGRFAHQPAVHIAPSGHKIHEPRGKQ